MFGIFFSKQSPQKLLADPADMCHAKKTSSGRVRWLLPTQLNRNMIMIITTIMIIIIKIIIIKKIKQKDGEETFNKPAGG